jgi:hypothetical protein
MACGDGGSATAEWREPTSSDQLPIHRSESPTGYSSAGCSPAEPASASPGTDNSSPNPIQLANQMRCSTSLRDAGKLTLLVPLPSARGGCHLYFARRVTFLSCADIIKHITQRGFDNAMRSPGLNGTVAIPKFSSWFY